MRFRSRLPVVAVLLALPLFMGPAAQIPEKLTAGTAQWNTNKQSVDIPLFTEFKSVADDQGDAYSLQGNLTVNDGTETYSLRIDSQPVVKLSEPEAGRPTPLEPASFQWDRDGGRVTGSVTLTGTVLLVLDQGDGPPTDSVDVFGTIDVN